MSPEEQEKRRSQAGKTVAESALSGTERFMEDAFKPGLKNAPRHTRYVLKTVPGLGSAVYAGAQLLTAKDKWRAGAEVAGGLVGGLAGGAMGAATGPAAVVAAPTGAAVGSAAGAEFATDLYDKNYARIRPVTREIEDAFAENARRIAATGAWIRDRNDRKAR